MNSLPSGAGASARPEFADRYVDLAQPRLGAAVIAVTDDFFAAAERLINPEPPIFVPGKYDDHGKWMDGWESRRKRTPGHDHCVLRICPGTIRGVDIDTSHFTGNYPPEASLDACRVIGDPDDGTEWQELLPRTHLAGDSHHFIAIDDERIWTHLRLNIYPDGGVARLRVYGTAHRDWGEIPEGETVDLAAMRNGGRALACNDMHFGHMSNLIAPGHPVNMGDGWETRRRRTPGNDWVILRLARPGTIRRVQVDTAYFKGNYPARCALHGALLPDRADADVTAEGDYWQPILPEVPLGPDHMHEFEDEVLDAGRVSHVRLDIFPDGGVGRLRLFGDWREL
ncbi:allantoicase [Elongatibacter sediminis]|uniref:Probable allantoicase n=1 Tax=Elongatibacter sediminis TaxID=3119006 RepID=A0AAW9RHD4_9GAMM